MTAGPPPRATMTPYHLRGTAPCFMAVPAGGLSSARHAMPSRSKYSEVL